MTPNLQLAEQFFAATACGDAQALHDICSSNFKASQNNGPAMDITALVTFSQAVLAAVDNFRYANPVRADTGNGFVEEHDVLCDLPDGTLLNIRVCVVADVVDGRISALREYVDTQAASGLIAALS